MLPRVGARPGAGDDATTLLPRTPAAGRASAIDDDDDDFDARPAPGQRLRLALLVGAVAAVVIIPLAIGYAVISANERPGVLPSTSSGPSSSDTSSPSPTPETGILDDTLLLSAKDALVLDKQLAWKVSRTQTGPSADVEAACLSGEPVEGQPSPQQVLLRLVSSNGTSPVGALHRADAYATPEDAAQAYAVTAREFGGCSIPGGFIDQGRIVGGIGDQAVGVVLRVSDGSSTSYRSVGMSRTGRVLNILDIAQKDRAVSYSGVTRALAAVTAKQCRIAEGRCNGAVNAKEGPPPVGGDEPGLLAAGDIPPAGTSLAGWVGTTSGAPKEDFTGSGCETTNWATVKATSRVARTYLQAEDATSFGVDNIVITTASNRDAVDLVEKVKSDLDSCAKRKLTAKVSDVQEASGRAAQDRAIEGWTAVVTQEADSGPLRYRVGIVSAGSKVAYTFLNPQKDLDLTKEEFAHVAVRAAERATQVK